MDSDNLDLRLKIHLFFEGRTMGADWAGGFKNDYGCDGQHRSLAMYTLNNDASYAVGGPGAWQFGTLLHFNHQPASQYFGFQFGDGANNQGDDNGFSGWFSWNGAITRVRRPSVSLVTLSPHSSRSATSPPTVRKENTSSSTTSPSMTSATSPRGSPDGDA